MCHDVTFMYNVDVSNVAAYFAFMFFHGTKKLHVQNQQFNKVDTKKEEIKNVPYIMIYCLHYKTGC